MPRIISDGADRVAITDVIDEVLPTGIWLGTWSPDWSTSSERRVFIPRKLILFSDVDPDELVQGEEVTLEIPRWKAVQLGLVE